MNTNWQEILNKLPQNPETNPHLFATISEQQAIAEYIKIHEGVLITEWIALDDMHKTYWYVLYYYQSKWIFVSSQLHPKRPVIVDLSVIFPVANRLQRAIYDLTKITTKQAQDKRPWFSHGHFKTGILNPNVTSSRHANATYHFNKVSGDGVHEVPVGPVHAGIIEPGHFRFSVVGERILKLEERLGYTHKGIHQLLIGKSLAEASRLIGRISGDSTVAYSYAFALACEQQLVRQVGIDTCIMRVILLERERLINHIGDIGAIINDTGFSSLASQFLILKETLVRENVVLTGHRYMMDAIVPNQPLKKWDQNTVEKLLNHLDTTLTELSTLQSICQRHHGLQDRLKTTGIISSETALALGLLGVAAKASGLAVDVRASQQNILYQTMNFTPIIEKTGDVAARLMVRFQEAKQSIKIIKHLLTSKQTSDIDLGSTITSPFALGCVEGWRGPVCVMVKLTPDHHIAWCHFHDPSWQNWLALEYAIMGNIIADFPLINKSFNLSYSGQDS